MQPRVAYVMSRFPHLPETFILREMSALRDLGWDVRLCPLILQEQPIVHEEALPWVAGVRQLSGPRRTLPATLRALWTQPLAVLKIVLAVVSGYRREPRALLRALAMLPRSLVLAENLDGVDRVHAHYATYPLLAAWVAHRLTGTPYSVTVHAHDIFLSTAMLRTKLAHADLVVAISRYNAEFLARVDPAFRAKTAVIHCGVALDRYAPASAPPNGEMDLLCVGSLQEYKGHRYLIEACRVLRDRGVPIRCTIVGEGVERPRLEAAVSAAGLEDVVRLVGARSQDDVSALLSRVDCFVQPSVVAADGQMEGIPVALMEALASHLPVVASDLSGIGELVVDGVTGWLVPPAQPAALADALQAVHDDPLEAARRAAAGRELVHEQFDVVANVKVLAGRFAAAHPMNESDVP